MRRCETRQVQIDRSDKDGSESVESDSDDSDSDELDNDGLDSQLWSFDSKGQLRSKSNPRWCMAWPGGKIKYLVLIKCDSRKTRETIFEYDVSQKAIIMTNTKNDKKILVGFKSAEADAKLLVYKTNTQNASVRSFSLMTT